MIPLSLSLSIISSSVLSANEFFYKFSVTVQQFHEWLANKAKPKVKSPTHAQPPEDLAERLHTKLVAAEQKRFVVSNVDDSVSLSPSLFCNTCYGFLYVSGSELYLSICTYTYVHIYMHACIHTHTYIHMHMHI